MPRTDRQAAQQGELLPLLAQAFSDLGYRRATTASIARRCEVRENILYRRWNDKAAMRDEIARREALCKVSLPMRAFREAPTVAALANYIEAAQWAASMSRSRKKRGG